MKKIILILSGICLCIALYGQTTYDTTYTNGHIGYAIMPNAEGYAIAGNAHNGQLWLYQINQEGKVQWEYTYGRRFGLTDLEFMDDATPSLDGGYFLVGSSFSIPDSNWGGKAFAYAVKTDSSGAMLWDRQFYATYDSSRISRFYQVLATRDGGCLASGEILLNPSDTARVLNPRLFIVKLDKDGEVEFEKIYATTPIVAGRPENADYYAPTIELPGQEGYLLLTSTDYGREIYLLKLDRRGDTVWTRRYKPKVSIGQRFDNIKDLIQTQDGNYLLSSIFSGYMIKVDANGDTLWTNYDQYADHITELPNGDLLCSRYSNIARLTADGEVLWEKTYNHLIGRIDFIRIVEVVPADDDGFMVIINTRSGLRLLRTDCEGNVLNPISCTTGIGRDRSFGGEFHISYEIEAWSANYTLPTNAKGSFQLRLLSLLGQELSVQQLTTPQGSHRFSQHNLSAGLYLIQLTDAEGQVQALQKIIRY